MTNLVIDHPALSTKQPTFKDVAIGDWFYYKSKLFLRVPSRSAGFGEAVSISDGIAYIPFSNEAQVVLIKNVVISPTI